MDIYDSAFINSSEEKPPTQLDSQVNTLVSGISSWWSGVADKSQAQLEQAKKHVEEQGGLLSLARNEYAKLSETQNKAGEQTDDATTLVDKGKARQQDTPTSFFSKITSDPRLVALQNNLMAALPKDESGKTWALSDLSTTIQAHLPHLDLSQSQQLANKYLVASENFAKDLGKDMKELANELVKIVPPEEAYKELAVEERNVVEEGYEGEALADKKQVMLFEAEDKDKEDDFDWGDEEEAANAAKAKDGASKETGKALSVPATTAAPALTQPNKDEADSDSDWE